MRSTLDRHLYEEAAVKGILRWCLARSQILPYFRTPALCFLELSYRSDARRVLCVACGTRRTNLYPAGFNPGPQSLAHCEGASSRAGRDLSLPRHLSALARSRSHIHLGCHDLLLSVFVLVPHPLRTAPCGTTPVSR
jgi:hypothetical protein